MLAATDDARGGSAKAVLRWRASTASGHGRTRPDRLLLRDRGACEGPAHTTRGPRRARVTRPGARGARAGPRRPHQPRDRRAPLHLAQDRGAPRRPHPDQAGCAQPRRGGRPRGAPRRAPGPSRSSGNRGPNGGSPDVRPWTIRQGDRRDHGAGPGPDGRPSPCRPTIDEIAPDVFRLSTFVPEVAPGGFTFNQFLRPRRRAVPLPHRACGSCSRWSPRRWPRSLPGRVAPLDHLRPRRGRRVRGDEPRSSPRRRRPRSSTGRWLHGVAQRPGRPAPRALGRRRGHRPRRQPRAVHIPTPHVPHGWETRALVRRDDEHAARAATCSPTSVMLRP